MLRTKTRFLNYLDGSSNQISIFRSFLSMCFMLLTVTFVLLVMFPFMLIRKLVRFLAEMFRWVFDI
jgi:hypothetical protein